MSGLLDWIPKEFFILGNILTLTSNNSAVVTCKNAFALLEHEGCQDLQKLTAHEYRLPEPSEMEASIANVQTVKRAFLRRFWLTFGWQTIRDAAQARLEEVSVACRD